MNGNGCAWVGKKLELWTWINNWLSRCRFIYSEKMVYMPRVGIEPTSPCVLVSANVNHYTIRGHQAKFLRSKRLIYIYFLNQCQTFLFLLLLCLIAISLFLMPVYSLLATPHWRVPKRVDVVHEVKMEHLTFCFMSLLTRPWIGHLISPIFYARTRHRLANQTTDNFSTKFRYKDELKNTTERFDKQLKCLMLKHGFP